MSKKSDGENRDQPLPIRPKPTAANAEKKLVSLLKELGVTISQSELVRVVAAPCFAPHLPYQLRPGHTVTHELVDARALSELIDYRFFAAMLPLIEKQDAVVSVEALAGGRWELLIWMSYEHLYRLEAQELEKAACAEEKSGKSETCGKATTIVYLTRRERRAANRRAKRLALKRARESGESRLVRLFVEDGVPKLLKEVEERRETLEKAPQPQNPNPEGGTPNG